MAKRDPWKVTLGLVAGLSILACGGGAVTNDQPTTTNAPVATTTPPTTQPPTTAAPTTIPTTTAPPAAAPNRCEAVSPALVAGISSGLKGATGLRFASAVKSKDFANVYMVAADLEGPALEGADDQAVWATNDLAGGGGLIFSVDGMAKQFSSWGPGDRTDAKIGAASDGVNQAKGCSVSAAKAP